ncbi:hypothetical protein P879_01919 [Paragonimus westermani]|uniref:Phosphorylated adapter RNA export protein n=1 Tax=Paragonimus westermani TaxID=34504 RepID=A0A8T0DLG9_9TREM|nr:hypothetical protein P879_01919 [Paragonimus westermani]
MKVKRFDHGSAQVITSYSAFVAMHGSVSRVLAYLLQQQGSGVGAPTLEETSETSDRPVDQSASDYLPGTTCRFRYVVHTSFGGELSWSALTTTCPNYVKVLPVILFNKAYSSPMAHRSQLLQDSSESDDDDDEVFWKKRTSSGVKRTADSFDSEASPRQSQIARRSIWLNVLNENKLNEALSKVNVQANINMPACLDNCAVPSDQYNTNARNIRKRNRRRFYNRNRPSKMRVCEPHGDKSVLRTHYRMNSNDSTNSVKRALVKLLKEPNEELISQVVHILGVKRTLEFYFLTEEVENAGGLHTADGSRRRSPGGVFLNLIKNSNSVADLEKAKIFATTKRTKELSKRRRQQARRLRKLQSGSVNELGQFRSELTPVEYSVQANSAKHEDICSKTEADPQLMNTVEEGEISSFEDEEDEVSVDR